LSSEKPTAAKETKTPTSEASSHQEIRVIHCCGYLPPGLWYSFSFA